MNTPRELTSRVCPADSRLPLFTNFTEIGNSSENRRVDRFSGCGCAMVRASNAMVPLALILAHVAQILLDILECESDLFLSQNPETRRQGGNRGIKEELKE
jgi:hypothetical protein